MPASRHAHKPRSGLTRSLPRSHWNKTRGRKAKAKHPFSSLHEARKHIEEHRLTEYRAYHCPVCGLFHIGHRTPSNKRGG